MAYDYSVSAIWEYPVKYKDPLHVPSIKLVVSFNGIPKMMLNKQLLDKQNCWDRLDLIKQLHEERFSIEERMTAVDENSTGLEAYTLDKEWCANQFALQRAWGFPENNAFHAFWSIPTCKCPRLDNSERYGYGSFFISESCHLHWKSLQYELDLVHANSTRKD
jgi:hypothetical protein